MSQLEQKQTVQAMQPKQTNPVLMAAGISWGKLTRDVTVSFVFLTALLGLVYPSVMTGVGQSLMADKATGSILNVGEQSASALIGQNFAGTRLFEGRASAVNYDAGISGGSNLSMSNPAQKTAIAERVAYWQKKTGSQAPVPLDLITASGSGLDPHISLSAARYQAAWVAQQNGLPLDRVLLLINQSRVDGWFQMATEPSVNVIKLNASILNALQKR